MNPLQFCLLSIVLFFVILFFERSTRSLGYEGTAENLSFIGGLTILCFFISLIWAIFYYL